MSAIELLALRIRQLERHPEDVERASNILKQTRIASKEQFEKRFSTRLTRTEMPPGSLVLVRNTTVEKELDRKSKPRYLGPYKVLRRTQNGSYALTELDGTL